MENAGSDPAGDIRSLPPFDRMSDAEGRAVQRLSVPLALRKGKALYYQGDRADRLFILVSGAVRGVMYRSDETSLEMGRSERGDWLGLAEVLLEGQYLNDALAEESCRLLAFPRSSLGHLLGVGTMKDFFLREMAKKHYILHSRIELNTPLDRLVRFLRDRCEQVGSAEVGCTQEEIAEAIGVTRETVNKHLRRLHEEGLIRIGRGSVRVLDAEGLKGRIG